ncbi:MAG: tetratricopeptide repeat protein [Crocinitomicaceae bacterium]|nr:tetratricopeptide repeat protein [Crocinitomicaceae bacterium]
MNIEVEIDQVLESSRPKREKIDAIIDYCMAEIDQHTGRNYLLRVQQGFDLMKDQDYPRGEGYLAIAYAYQLWKEYKIKEMQQWVDKALRILEDVGEETGIITALTVRTFGKLAIGDFAQAFQSSIKAIKISKRIEPTATTGWVYYIMGVMYFDIKDFENAIKYYKKGLELFVPIGHTFGIARTKPGLGSCYLEIGKYKEAEKLLNEAILEFTENPNAEGLSRAINDLGVLYLRQGNFSKAEKYLKEAYDIRAEMVNKRGYNTTLLDMAELRILQNKTEDALELLQLSLDLSQGNDAKPKQMRAQNLLYRAYKAQGAIDKAFFALENYLSLKEEVSSSETNHKLKLQESNFAFEKASELAELEREKNRQLKLAHDEIAEKQKEITDSINYAKRIQRAILPPSSLIKDKLKDSFVLYKPKDIVAGDFYWMESKNGTTLFAAADCTGHGVPGAMVSVVCNNALNRCIREYQLTDPGEILNKTREIVIKEFEKAEDDVKDGMDIALCSLRLRSDYNERLEISKEETNRGMSGVEVHYAGANNPLWIIRNGTTEVEEIKANKQPIGQFDHPEPYTTHKITLKKGDTIYVFSDGFADQFGGEKGKKYKASNFKKLLVSVCHESMPKQKKLIDEAFESWKGNLEQLDDVCVIGVRI